MGSVGRSEGAGEAPPPLPPRPKKGGLEEKVAKVTGGRFAKPIEPSKKPHSIAPQPSTGKTKKVPSPSPSARSPSPALDELRGKLETMKDSLENKFSLLPEEFVMLKRLSEDIKKLESPEAKELLRELENKWSKEIRQRRLA